MIEIMITMGQKGSFLRRFLGALAEASELGLGVLGFCSVIEAIILSGGVVFCDEILDFSL